MTSIRRPYDVYTRQAIDQALMDAGHAPEEIAPWCQTAEEARRVDRPGCIPVCWNIEPARSGPPSQRHSGQYGQRNRGYRVGGSEGGSHGVAIGKEPGPRQGCRSGPGDHYVTIMIEYMIVLGSCLYTPQVV